MNQVIDYEVWSGCIDQDFDDSVEAGRPCYGGLVMSTHCDVTWLALHFEPTEADPVWRQFDFWWTELHAEDYPLVIRRSAEILSRYNVRLIAYDRWRIDHLNRLMHEAGVQIPVVPFGWGYVHMSPALDEYESRLKARKIRHRGHRAMGACLMNAVVMKDGAGNRKVSIAESTGIVEGLIASIMAVGVSVNPERWSQQRQAEVA